MVNYSVLAALAGLVLSGSGAGAQTLAPVCGGGDAPCEIGAGYYFTALPQGAAQGAPVVLWLHGYNGRADRAARARGMARNFISRGYVFVAPQGRPDPARPEQRDWNVRDGFDQPRDDVAFLSAVLDDVAARLGTDPDRVLLAGFSRGGSMAWDYACAAPKRIAGVAAISGGFWEPMAQDCAGPVNLFHTHGFSDRMVPLEGRKVTWEGRDFQQGNILKGLDIWRGVNGCTGAADINAAQGTVWEKRWTTCAAGSLRLQITPGGHGIPKGWSTNAMDWFEGLSPTPG